MKDNECPQAILSPSQMVQLMAISVMLRDGDLDIVGEDAELARDALVDAGQEIALHSGSLVSRI